MTRAPRSPRPRADVHLLAELRSEIARADAKATVLVGMLGVTAGVLSALLINLRWSPARLSVPAALLWWSGSALLVTSLVALLLAVTPRYGRNHWAPGRPLTYFDDINRAVRAGLLAAALADTERSPARALRTALAENSRIAARKHFWIRTGLIAFGGSTVLLPMSLLVA
ncbi:Pycsar system effector family protein [Streptomyces sp. NRRL B-24085]|uniref:Pycsar system effector family protein n=1 Tax=Streptomyces sp. NRRL B-24085 TaxID=1709476 RepID=UPI0006B2FA23|nr:Pycsar system effector family protein [Streptomyces sp. NRRL B-24085]